MCEPALRPLKTLPDLHPAKAWLSILHSNVSGVLASVPLNLTVALVPATTTESIVVWGGVASTVKVLPVCSVFPA